MIYNDQLFAIEDQIYVMIEKILMSDTFLDYCKNKEVLYRDKKVNELIADFNKEKTAFEKIAPYGEYAPAFKEQQRAVRISKRKMDLHPLVAEFRFSETCLQSLLDQICITLAEGISADIKVDTGNPFFERKTGCGGHCHGS